MNSLLLRTILGFGLATIVAYMSARLTLAG
jgi:hypothetical protein